MTVKAFKSLVKVVDLFAKATMSEDYSFVKNKSSSDDADLESLIGLKKQRPKRSKLAPIRYQDQIMDAVEEANLEETIGELSILVCVIIIVVWCNQTITHQPLIDVPILSASCIMIWKHLSRVARTMNIMAGKSLVWFTVLTCS